MHGFFNDGTIFLKRLVYSSFLRHTQDKYSKFLIQAFNINGIFKRWYGDGALWAETAFEEGEMVYKKEYDKDGRIIFEALKKGDKKKYSTRLVLSYVEGNKEVKREK